MKDWRKSFGRKFKGRDVFRNWQEDYQDIVDFIQSLLDKKDKEWKDKIENIKDNASLEDESNGRYNRENELREAIEDIKNNLNK